MSREVCRWCGRHYESTDGYGYGLCSYRCFEESQQGEEQKRYQEQQQHELEQHNREMRQLEAQRQEDDRNRHREMMTVKEINRHIDGYDAFSIAGAPNIYNKVCAMYNQFKKISSCYCGFDEYAREVMYRLGNFDGAVERYRAEKKAVEQREDQQRQEELRNILLKHISFYITINSFSYHRDEIYILATKYALNIIDDEKLYNKADYYIRNYFKDYDRASAIDDNGQGYTIRGEDVAQKRIEHFVEELKWKSKDIKKKYDEYIVECTQKLMYKKSQLSRDEIEEIVLNHPYFEGDNNYDIKKSPIKEVYINVLLSEPKLNYAKNEKELEAKRLSQDKNKDTQQSLRDKYHIMNTDFLIVEPGSLFSFKKYSVLIEPNKMKPFAICAHPVTEQEYSGSGISAPVTKITWYQAIAYCNKRSKQEKLTPCYELVKHGLSYEVKWNEKANGYRLPTFAEITVAPIAICEKKADERSDGLHSYDTPSNEEKIAAGMSNDFKIKQWLWDFGEKSYQVWKREMELFEMEFGVMCSEERTRLLDDGCYIDTLYKEDNLGFRLVRSLK